MITKKSLQNLNGLLMLSAIAKYHSKRKVAEVTNSSIDTVNKYISNLEQMLGVQLVVNNARGTHLTDRALEIVEQVENVQELLDKIYDQHHFDNKYEGEVCVCLPLMLSTALFPSGVTGFCEEHPDIKVISLATLEALDYNDMGIDFGIVSCEPRPSKEFALLYEKSIDCCFFASKNYLDKYGYPNNLDDLLQNHKIVEVLQNKNYFPKWRGFIAEAKNVSFSSNSAYAVIEAMRHGLGVGLMPKQFKDKELVRLDNLENDFQMKLCLIVNKRTRDIPRVKIVTDYYKAALDRI